MSLRLVVKPDLCIGCRTCELSCAFTHGREGMPGASRCITHTVAEDEYVPMMCLQCDDAACAQACPTDALALDEATGVVLLDQDRCVRCLACTVACPFGNLHFDPTLKLVHKCDLCAGHGNQPRCALFCPTKCLLVEQVPDPQPTP